jgi:putative addiction module CopG family antidote
VVGRKTRNLSLTSQLEAFINGRVAQCRLRSASEVVRADLRLWIRGHATAEI